MTQSNKIKPDEITPEETFLNRRNFIRAAVAAGSVLATGSIYRFFNPVAGPETASAPLENVVRTNAQSPANGSDQPNSFEQITNYNNYYEFSTSKTAVARAAGGFITRPWTVAVGGLAAKPRIFDIDELLRFDQEERIYRFRCVEGWSMVIPWNGFPLAKLLAAVEPLSTAKYVAFETFYGDRSKDAEGVRLPEGRNGMQSSFSAGIDLPYVEGLRLDEAMHPLTLLATGIYGKQMPNQNGAPIRLVVPWKYGFKSIKSVIRITLTDRQPPTTWNLATPREYGFYSNVNPEVSHPRWSQADEQRIGEYKRRPTLMFNGYADEVADLYKGMDLRKNF